MVFRVGPDENVSVVEAAEEPNNGIQLFLDLVLSHPPDAGLEHLVALGGHGVGRLGPSVHEVLKALVSGLVELRVVFEALDHHLVHLVIIQEVEHLMRHLLCQVQ